MQSASAGTGRLSVNRRELDHFAMSPDHGTQVLSSVAELCTTCRLRCLPLFQPFSPRDLEFVQRMLSGRRCFAQEADLWSDAKPDGGPCTLWEGWAYTFREFAGSGKVKRQILEILLPGDMFGLGAMFSRRVGHPVRALTGCTVCVHNPNVFSTIFTKRPRLVRALVQTLITDAQRAQDRLAVIGQGSGAQRAAHLILETRERLAQRGAMFVANADDTAACMPFPLQRRHLAAALGMSAMHVGRSFAELEARGYVRHLEGNAVTILDPEGLAAFCNYVPLPDEMGYRLVL